MRHTDAAQSDITAGSWDEDENQHAVCGPLRDRPAAHIGSRTEPLMHTSQEES